MKLNIILDEKNTKTKKIAISDKIKELIFFVRKSEIMLDI